MMYAYVGCRTTKERNARGEGLKTYAIEASGQWRELQCLVTEPNPSYQTLDREGKFLYSVHGDFTKASSYKILPDHTLEHINTIDIGGRNPVDITVDKENRRVIVATLQGGPYTASSGTGTALSEKSSRPSHTRGRSRARSRRYINAYGTEAWTTCSPPRRDASTAMDSSAL